MKKIIFGIAINFLLINFCLGQNFKSVDFFELGIKSSKFIESSFLENSKYQKELSDPNTEIEGLIASPTGRNYSANFRYGKEMFSKVHLLGEFGFSKLNEQVLCFCHVCDKVSNPSTLVSLNAINVGVGTRYHIFKIKKINFALDAIGNFSFLTNESGIKYFGYALHPFVEYPISKNLNINLKFGYEESFKNYQKKEKSFEFAMNYQIQKKAH